MTRKKSEHQKEILDDLQSLRDGFQAGIEFQHDQSEYHTLEDIPDPFVPDKPKRKLTGKALERVRRNKAPNWEKGQTGNPQNKNRGKKGRDPLREIGMQIAFTNASLVLSPKQKKLVKQLGYAPGDIKLIEALMIMLATSANPNKTQLFLDRTFGKVPNISLHAQYNEDLVKRFRSKLTDSELEQIADGADVFDILLSKLPDVDEDDPVGLIEATTVDIPDGDEKDK